MAKHRLIELTLVLVILGVSVWNVKQQQETVYLREAIEALDEDRKELQVKKEELINENDQLTKQVAASSKSLKELQKQITNSGADTDENTEFINIVTQLFEANLNFSPENYENRKQEVSGYLSDELKKEYFGQNRKTYQDGNGTSSKLESIDFYLKDIQNRQIKGLVVVYYKSKRDRRDWTKGMNIYNVTYDFLSKKIVKIINLGSGYTGDYD